jgi:hypothetical protein
VTTIYLALGGATKHVESGFTKPPAVAALCSYVYYEPFAPLLQHSPGVRQWILDSGAFSAFNSGKAITLTAYIDFCKRLNDTERPPCEVYALDVIGDWRASLRNVDAMWKAGVPAVPCYHAGEPEAVLVGMAKDYPKIAVGGAAGRLYGERRIKYLQACFARVWPKKIHGFGITTSSVLHTLPFHSVDATSWQLGATRYGQWKAYKMPVTGVRTGHYLRPEVDVFLQMEAQLKSKWAAQMAQLEALP